MKGNFARRTPVQSFFDEFGYAHDRSYNNLFKGISEIMIKCSNPEALFDKIAHMKDEFSEVVEQFRKYLHSVDLMGISSLALSEDTLDFVRKETSVPRKEKRISGHAENRKVSEKGDLKIIGEGKDHSDIFILVDDSKAENMNAESEKKLEEIIEKGLKIKKKEVSIARIMRGHSEKRPSGKGDGGSATLIDLLAKIQPKVIFSLGKGATSLLLERDLQIEKERGEWFEYRGIKVMPSYHPSYLLKNYTTEKRKEMLEDVKEILRELGRG